MLQSFNPGSSAAITQEQTGRWLTPRNSLPQAIDWTVGLIANENSRWEHLPPKRSGATSKWAGLILTQTENDKRLVQATLTQDKKVIRAGNQQTQRKQSRTRKPNSQSTVRTLTTTTQKKWRKHQKQQPKRTHQQKNRRNR